MSIQRKFLPTILIVILVSLLLIYRLSRDEFDKQNDTADIYLETTESQPYDFYPTDTKSKTEKTMQKEVTTYDTNGDDFVIDQFGLEIVPPIELAPGFGFFLDDPARPIQKHDQLGTFTLGNYSYTELESRGERVEEVLPADYKGIEAHIYFDNGKRPDGSFYDTHELLSQYIVHSDILSKSKDRIVANESGDYYEVRRYDNFVIIMWYVPGKNISLDDMTQLCNKIEFKTLSQFNPTKGLSEAFIKQLESNQ
jgi:hypothetical protein